jgi:lipopolysaccharide heptosyltransferase II
MKKILIINYQGIGNTVLMMPFFSKISKSKLFHQFDMSIRNHSLSGLLTGEGIVDNYIFYDDHSKINKFLLLINRFKLLQHIRKTNYEVIINMDQSHSLLSMLFMKLLKSTKKIGINTRNTFFKVYDDQVIFEAMTQSEQTLYNGILEKIGIEGSSVTFPIFSLTEKDQQNNYLKSVNKKKLNIAIHPGCGTFDYKRWEKEKFNELIISLIKNEELHILILGGKEEALLANSVLDNVPSNKYTNLVGQLNIRETLSILKKSFLLISNDSGVMHLGAAMEVPVVAIFGPTSYIKNHPLGDKTKIIISENFCNSRSNSICDECKIQWKQQKSVPLCLQSISVNDVLNEVNKFI